MKHRKKFALMLPLYLCVMLAVCFKAPQVVDAQGPGPVPVIAAPNTQLTLPNSVGIQFVHFTTTANTSGDGSSIDHPLTNANANTIVFVTPNFNPSGGSGLYHNHPIGVYYDSGTSKWWVFNEDTAAMSTGHAFNILIPPSDSAVFVHTATVGNISGHITYIDNPLTNNNPNVRLLVTQNFNPGGGTGTYNNHAIGVYYDGAKWTIFNQDIGAMPVGAAFNVLVLPAGSPAFVHKATSGNTSGNLTAIDNPLTNNNPNAIVHITQNWNPGGVGGTYNNHATGVYYNGSRWTIRNQDGIDMPLGAAFNVLITTPESAVLAHTTTTSNTFTDYTSFSNSLTNGKPNTLVFVTPSYWSSTYNNHPLGVGYDGSYWTIFNEDIADMPLNATFNVWVPPMDTAVFVHKSTSANTSGDVTYINSPLTNGQYNALVFATPNYNPGGVGGIYNNHRIGVYYDISLFRWAVLNEDFATMSTGTAFNVWVAPSGAHAFVHISTAENVLYDSTIIDNPLTNNRPNVVLIVTPNYNPGGSGGIAHNHTVGVYYYGTRWTIFNEDGTNMPAGVAFNVFVTDNKLFLPRVVR